jgi:triosephosphate isomerase (TIM)
MKLIVANWKLNPETLKEAQKLVLSAEKVSTKNKLIICPPFVFLPLIKTKHALGSQDLFWEDKGPYTGQISAAMLRQFKVQYAIIGHSEKRALGETEEEVSLKIKAALNNKITPILCVGFGVTASESDDDVCADLQGQLSSALRGVDPTKVIVAYEPVWAISSHKHAKAVTREHAEKIAMFIKIKYGVKKVLYGGSVNASDYKTFESREIDGLLVGHASIETDQLQEIISNYK